MSQSSSGSAATDRIAGVEAAGSPGSTDSGAGGSRQFSDTGAGASPSDSAASVPRDGGAAAATSAAQFQAAGSALAEAAAVGGISSVSAASATAPTSFAQNYPPLQQQLAQPIITLSQSGAGEHILSVRVAPDDLGPVTVQAHVSDSGVRIELFAPNDDSRDAIKQILPDLRKDLNQSAGGGSVDVSDRNAPGADSERQDQHNWNTPSDGTRRGLRDDRQDATTATTAPRPSGEHVLDVLV